MKTKNPQSACPPQISTRKTKTTKAQAAGPCTSDAKNQDTKGPGFLGLAPLARIKIPKAQASWVLHLWHVGLPEHQGAQAALGPCMPMAKRATEHLWSGAKEPGAQAAWTFHLWRKDSKLQMARLAGPCTSGAKGLDTKGPGC